MTMPPYIAGAISAIVLSKLSDHFQWRAVFIFGQMAVALVGFCILLPLAPNITSQIGPCYLAVMLICIGQYPTNPAGSAWISSNLAGDTKRAVGIALNICLGNSGGIVGSVGLSWQIFHNHDTESAPFSTSSSTPKSPGIQQVSVLASHLLLSPWFVWSLWNFRTGGSTSRETRWTRRSFDSSTPRSSLLDLATSLPCSGTSTERVLRVLNQ